MLVELQFTVMRCYANSAPQTSWLDFGERKGRGNGKREKKGKGRERARGKGEGKEREEKRRGQREGREEEGEGKRKMGRSEGKVSLCAVVIFQQKPCCTTSALRLSPVALYAVINRFIDDMFSYIFHLILTAMPSMLLPSVL